MLARKTFTIRPLPTLHFGAGASLNLADHVRAVGMDAALIVTDRTLRQAGVADAAIAALQGAGVRCDIFDGVEANPTDRNVEAGAVQLRAFGEACVLAFGGGSSMDCGKAIALLATNGEDLAEMQAKGPANPAVPVIAVPTTAGTGSETNNACVITNTKLGRKGYVIHPSITPAAAVLDPELTLGLPPYPTATCGFDVLTHAMEAFVSLRATPYSDAVALEAVRLVAAHLRGAVADGGNLEARAQMLLASAMAAIAFNVAGLGAAHGTGHALSARLNAAHGQTLATMAPHVAAYNLETCPDKYAEIARILSPAGEDVVTALLQLRADIGLDRSIRDLGADDALLPTLVADAAADFVNRTNPRPVDAAAIESLYRAAW